MKTKSLNTISRLLSVPFTIAVFSVTIQLDVQHRNIVGMGEYKLGSSDKSKSEFIPSGPDFYKKSAPLENLIRYKLPDRRSVRI